MFPPLSSPSQSLPQEKRFEGLKDASYVETADQQSIK